MSRIGCFAMTAKIWENQGKSFSHCEVVGLSWSRGMYYVTAKSEAFEEVNDGDVIPDYEVFGDGRMRRIMR